MVVRQIFSLGGWGSAGLFVTADGDAAVAASVFGPPTGLWPGQGQQSIGRQGAGDGRLVHSGGEAVAAVKLPGDVAMVILEKQRSSSKQKNFLFWNKLRAYVDLWSLLKPLMTHKQMAFHFLNLLYQSKFIYKNRFTIQNHKHQNENKNPPSPL